MEARDLPEQAQAPGNSFERAIALNPNFAMGYYGLSIAFNNAGDTDHAN
jgi:hypothetical protein